VPVRIRPWHVVGVAALTALVGFLAGAQPAAGSHGGAWHVVERASVASDGAQANLGSADVALSAEGRFVAFESIASNLVSGDTNNARDVFVRDRATGITERVSVASDGSQRAGPSADPSISADGRFVVFSSGGIFVHDRQTGATELVSVTSGGSPASGTTPEISPDGRFVAFASQGSLLPGVDCFVTVNNCVFVRDRGTGITELVARDAFLPVISADGRFVGFHNVDGGLFVRDRQTGATERVDVSSTGEPGGGFLGGLSADGRYVVFRSASGNLVPNDTNGENDVFVRDRQAGTTERVSVASDGSQANGSSLPDRSGSVSGDGRFILFLSNAPNLVLGDSNGAEDVFVHDRETRVTERVSVSITGNEGNDHSGGGQVISADAEVIAFGSRASNLIPEDTNGFPDILVATRGTAPPSPMDDNFDDNALDPNRWSRLVPPPGFSGDVSETNQRLEITVGSGAVGAGILSKCSVSGDFDVQVDYVLIDWPAGNSHGLRLLARDLGAASIERRSDPELESYTFVTGGSANQTPTSDSTGSLRLTRTGSTLSGYYLNGSTWALVGSGSVPTGNTRINLDLGTNDPAAPAVKAAFDNFKVNAGSVVCPPPPPEDADVAITKTDSPDPIKVGNNLTYTITVTNEGPHQATDVVLTDVLPGGVSLVPGGLGWTQGSCSGDATITCSLGDLASGSSANVVVVVQPTSAGILSNSASVSASSPDPGFANNSATTLTTAFRVVRAEMMIPPPTVVSTAGPKKEILDGFEPSIAVDPRDHSHAVVGFVALAPDSEVQSKGCWWAESRDSGASWKTRKLPLPRGFKSTADPWVRFARDGTLFYSCLGAHGTDLKKQAVFVAVSRAGDGNPIGALATDLGKKTPTALAQCDSKDPKKACLDRPSLAVLERPASSSGFRAVACWAEGLLGQRQIRVAYSNDGNVWVRHPDALSTPDADAAFCAVGGGSSRLAVAWMSGDSLKMRTSTDGLTWLPELGRPATTIAQVGDLVDTNSTTDSVWSVPFAQIIGDDLRAVYQRRVGDHSQVFVMDGPDNRPLGDPNSEKFLPGTGACPHLVGTYQKQSGLEGFRYTLWSSLTQETGDFGLLFESAASLSGSDGKSQMDVTTLSRIGDYTGVDCAPDGPSVWAVWTGPGPGPNHPRLWVTVISPRPPS
jgi:uncharacterized repeat protein (TIGR01451 family)